MAAPSVANWQAQILQGVGAPVTPQNVSFINAWARAEGGGASNNPFNTTLGYGPTSDYNSVHVRNYQSPSQGIQATIKTLMDSRYNNIRSALHRGNNSMAAANALAASPWGTGGLVQRILGGGGAVSPPAHQASGNLPLGGGGPQQGAGAALGDPKKAMAAMLLQSAQSGQGLNPSSLLQMAQMRQQQSAASRTFGPTPGGGGSPLAGMPTTGAFLPFEGNVGHIKPSLLSNLSAAARAVGATKIKVTSGYRDAQHNAAVHGAKNSNHLTGDAMDGFAYIPGKGWVPLGTALQGVAAKFGLRSGATFNWGGAPDIWHVDDRANQ